MANSGIRKSWGLACAVAGLALGATADALPEGAPRRVLRRRVGQIALSVVKNIAAYRLPEPVAGEALFFAKTHQKELSGYALASGNAPVMAQGALMALSVRAFLMIYTRLYRHL